MWNVQLLGVISRRRTLNQLPDNYVVNDGTKTLLITYVTFEYKGNPDILSSKKRSYFVIPVRKAVGLCLDSTTRTSNEVETVKLRAVQRNEVSKLLSILVTCFPIYADVKQVPPGQARDISEPFSFEALLLPGGELRLKSTVIEIVADVEE